jgi:hypothetical protein
MRAWRHHLQKRYLVAAEIAVQYSDPGITLQKSMDYSGTWHPAFRPAAERRNAIVPDDVVNRPRWHVAAKLPSQRHGVGTVRAELRNSDKTHLLPT